MSDTQGETMENLSSIGSDNTPIKTAAEPIGGLAPETAEVPTESASLKPEHLAGKFWDSEKNQVNLEALSTSYNQLEQRMTTKTESLKTQLETEFHENRLKQRPESPADYNPQAPDGFLPEQATFTADPDDPLLTFWRNTAHDLGLSQPEFEKGIASYIDHIIAHTPDPEVLAASLGENGKDRISSIQTWLTGKLGEDALKQFSPLFVTADGINNLEKVIGMTKDFQQGGASGATVTGGPLTQEQIEAKMRDPRYADPYKREKSFVDEVTNDWKRLKPDPEETLKPS